jgi:hypothetical protein
LSYPRESASISGQFDLHDRLKPMVASGEETLSEQDRRAIAEADQWLEHKDPLPPEEILAEFGLTMADWEPISCLL